MANKLDLYNAILLVDKEVGMTSHDVVAKLRRIINQRRIGHTGTLDKAASGLLVVCLGRSTKTAQFISDCDKEYIAEIKLGRISKTYDAEGVDFETAESDCSSITVETVSKTLDSFVGEIIQQVPAYSAVHVNGERLYKMANKGIDVELPKRNITIYAIELLEFKDNCLKIKVSCSKGTYIRSLAHDLGQLLQCGGYLSNLRRTSVGHLTVENSLKISEIENLIETRNLDESLLQFNEVVSYASCAVNNDFVDLVYNGNDIIKEYIDTVYDSYNVGDKVAIKDLTGNVLAVCKAEVPSNLIDNTNDQKLFSYIRVLN